MLWIAGRILSCKNGFSNVCYLIVFKVYPCLIISGKEDFLEYPIPLRLAFAIVQCRFALY